MATPRLDLPDYEMPDVKMPNFKKMGKRVQKNFRSFDVQSAYENIPEPEVFGYVIPRPVMFVLILIVAYFVITFLWDLLFGSRQVVMTMAEQQPMQQMQPMQVGSTVQMVPVGQPMTVLGRNGKKERVLPVASMVPQHGQGYVYLES